MNRLSIHIQKLSSLIFIMILLLGVVENAYAQNAPISTSTQQDKAISQTLSPSRGVIAQLEKVEKLKEENPVAALGMVKKALALAFKTKDQPGEIKCYQALGEINSKLGRLDEAVKNFNQAIALSEKIGYTQNLPETYQCLGAVYEEKGNTDSALKTYDWMVKNSIPGLTYPNGAVSIETIEGIEIEKRRANIYLQQGQNQKALQTFNEIKAKEKKIKRRNKNNIQAQSNSLQTYNGIGNAYTNLGDTTQALNSFRQVIKEAPRGNKLAEPELIAAYDNISRLYRSQNQFELELDIRKRALLAHKEYDNQFAETNQNQEIGDLLLGMKRPDEAIGYYENNLALAEGLASAPRKEDKIENKKPERKLRSNEISKIISKNTISNKDIELPAQSDSLIFFSSSANTNNTINSRDAQYLFKSRAYQGLAKAYEKKGLINKALENYKLSQEMADSLQIQQVEALESALREEQLLIDKDEEIRFLRLAQQANQSELDQQKVLTWALALGLLGILIAGFFIMRSHQSRQRANRLLALRSLRSQMNPHFIFNSLNSVNSFISKNDERSANKYLSDFSRLMRSVMEHSSHDFVPLTEELRVLELYLNLEHVRFTDKFTYQFEVDPTIDTSSIEIPPMLVQPYIENAIWHGLRYKESMGVLNVTFTQEGKQLIAIVEDNGIGRTRSLEIKTKNQKTHTSTGLKITAQRLELINSLYKTGMSVSIEDLNTEAKDVGTRVRIVIPCRDVVG